MDADRLMEFLTQEGFRPSLAARGEVLSTEVRFKYEGGQYFVRLLPSDFQYVAVVYPFFWPLGSPEAALRALRAANETAQRIKVMKIFVLEKHHDVQAEVEMLVERNEQFEAVFHRTLTILKAGVARFTELMRKSEPLPDRRIALAREDVTRWTHDN